MLDWIGPELAGVAAVVGTVAVGLTQAASKVFKLGERGTRGAAATASLGCTVGGGIVAIEALAVQPTPIFYVSLAAVAVVSFFAALGVDLGVKKVAEGKAARSRARG